MYCDFFFSPRHRSGNSFMFKTLFYFFKFNVLWFFFFVCVYVCVYMHVGALRGQKRMSDPLGVTHGYELPEVHAGN